jgi:ribosomal protein L40E/drug/metabolite transporter (DMT)-like permease
MKTCSKCGNTIADDALFCDKCGTQIKNDQKKICSTCGKQLDMSSQFCTKCGTSQNTSNPSVSTGLQKPKINNKQFAVIALCVSILLCLVLFPMFNLQSGYITTKDDFAVDSRYTLHMVGENYIAYTEYQDFANTLTTAFFIMILAALCAVSYFTVTGQKKYSLMGAIVNLGLLFLFNVIVCISWANVENYPDKAIAVMSAGSWISIILSVVLAAYIFNENIFKQILQKIKK